MTRVATRLRELRGDRRLRAVAAELGVSPGLLSEIERGVRLPPDEWIGALERVYGAPLEEWYSAPLAPLLKRDDGSERDGRGRRAERP